MASLTSDTRLSELPARDRQNLCNSLNEQKLQFYPAMRTIQQYVAERYLCLIMGTNWPDTIIDLLLEDEVLSPDPIQHVEFEKQSELLECISLDLNEDLVPELDDFICSLPKIPYADLEIATDNWNMNQILGCGAFGSVFAGNWKCTKVAVKRIEPNERDETNMHSEHIISELRFLSICRHDNILSIYAYSMEDTIHAPACLVYELMAGGSVHQCLFDRLFVPQPLKWIDRHNIAFGTARGLHYMHTFYRRPIIHGDIKPENILLDAELQPKIGDFGVAHEGLTGGIPMRETRLRGSRAYLPHEYKHTRLASTKLDIFSFGIVMLQLATALRAFDNSYKFLGQFVQKYNDDVDYLLMDQEPQPEKGQTAIFKLLIKLGKKCSSADASNRPADMMEIVQLQERL